MTLLFIAKKKKKKKKKKIFFFFLNFFVGKHILFLVCLIRQQVVESKKDRH
jgi:hypothetical protein